MKRFIRKPKRGWKIGKEGRKHQSEGKKKMWAKLKGLNNFSEPNYEEILRLEGLVDWKIKWNTGGGLCLYKSKEIWLSERGNFVLFLHELAHALCPKEICGVCWESETGHNAIWGDKFTTLVRKYLIK